METLKALATILGLIFSGIILRYGQLQEILSKRRIKRILFAKEANELFKNPTPFKKNFIEADLEESYFFIQTGIQCSRNNIRKYIDLKARLGDNWTWKQISIANPYLNRENDNIEVKLGKFTKIWSDIIFLTSLFLVICVPVVFATMKLLKMTPTNLMEIAPTGTLLVLPAIIGVILINSVNPILMANSLQKRIQILNSITQSN